MAKTPLIFHSYLQQTLIGVLVMMSGLTYSQVEIKNGVNLQASYYNNGHVNIGWELMRLYPEIEAVRIEIEPYRVQQARDWIREAHENGYQVIATYHNSQKLGTDDKQELINAANWWGNYYSTLSSSGPIIINLMNEWGSHNISPTDYANAYNEVIATVRTFYSDPLIIDVPGFGQATQIAADAYQYFDDENIIYSIHVYTSAFNIEQGRWLTHEDLAYLDATGADCMVGEFCDSSAGGSDWCSIIDHCFANGWPLFGWAWNGDGSNMNMVEPHWQDEPLATIFQPTEFMKIITDKLAGIPCYTEPDEDCNNSLIGEICDDGNEYTINDRYNEYCHCIGTFTSEFQSNNPSEIDMMIYPNVISSNREITIEFFQLNVKGEINIFNNLGQILLTKPIRPDQQKILINTNQFKSGIYWVNLQSARKVNVTKAFIVN